MINPAKSRRSKLQWEGLAKTILLSVAIVCFSSSQAAYIWADQSSQSTGLSDDEIRDILIQQSIASYPGTCACPYNRARNGSRCGKRSAYSKPGGYSPLCYRYDISDEMVRKYKKKKADKSS